MADENRAAERRAGQETKRASDTVKVIMSTYEGRWWMAELLARSNMYVGAYRFDGDSLGMAWRDGQADMGRFVLGQVDEYAPNEYQRLIREMRARNERAAEAARKALEPEQEPEAFAMMDELADRQMAEFQAIAAKGKKTEE